MWMNLQLDYEFMRADREKGEAIREITGDRNNQNILAVVYLHWAFTFRCWLCRESLGFVAL